MIRFHSLHCRSSWRRKTTTSNFFLPSFLHLQHQSHAENGAVATMKVSIHPESTCSTGLELVYLHTETLKYRNLDKFKILNTYDQKPKNVLSHKKVSFKATYKTHTKRRKINRWQTKGSQNLKSDISLKFKSLIQPHELPWIIHPSLSLDIMDLNKWQSDLKYICMSPQSLNSEKHSLKTPLLPRF